MTEEPFDFNAELNKLISSDLSDDSNNECLISREQLDDTKIKLDCGHMFNYEPLYNEIVKQKYGYRSTEVVRLNVNQIKCPYCRNIQNKVLPYASNLNLKKMIGINAPVKYQMLNDTCGYVSKSKKSKCYLTPCNSPCWGEYCKKHVKYSKKTEINKVVKNDNTEKTGCSCVLKHGLRKGETCNAKIFNDNKCKRHYNLSNK